MPKDLLLRRSVLSWLIPAILFDLFIYNIHALVEGDCKWVIYYPGRFSVMLMYGLIPLIVSRKPFFAVLSVFQIWLTIAFRYLYSVDMVTADALDDLLALFAFINILSIALLYFRKDPVLRAVTINWFFFGLGNVLDEMLMKNLWNSSDTLIEWAFFVVGFLIVIRPYVFNKKNKI